MQDTKLEKKFDYSAIPAGFYDKILFEEDGMRSFWHYQKFDAVLRSLKTRNGGKILDIGCSAGSFLSMLPERQFALQIGVDIASKQIDYAKKYETDFRHFLVMDDKNFLNKNFSPQYFDAITLIEVIEHLEEKEIAEIFATAAQILKSGGELVITTPNYCSSWPILEQIMARFLKPSYEEQHITKFTYFNFLSKIRQIYPDFDKYFAIEFQTSSHLALFALAGISSKFAKSLSQAVNARLWKMPFGALLILKLRRK